MDQASELKITDIIELEENESIEHAHARLSSIRHVDWCRYCIDKKRCCKHIRTDLMGTKRRSQMSTRHWVSSLYCPRCCKKITKPS